MTSILLVDDDVEFVALLKEYLQYESFEVATAYDGEAGVAHALSGSHSIAVLDVMMPRMNGIEVLRRIRKYATLPVLMLTAKGDDADRIIGLELGADDYVTKPCSPHELTARLRAILRRTLTAPPPVKLQSLVVGSLTMWPAQRRAAWSERTLQLTSTEYGLLEVLARNAGRTVSKNDLSEFGLGRPLARFDRSIDVHLSSIRRKLGALADGRSCIQTVFRKGYQLIGE